MCAGLSTHAHKISVSLVVHRLKPTKHTHTALRCTTDSHKTYKYTQMQTVIHTGATLELSINVLYVAGSDMFYGRGLDGLL